MNILKDITGSYCKVALISSEDSKGIVQSGYIRNVDIQKKIMILENENGMVQLPFHHIQAVKKIEI
ncbi:MAG TPA: hypothetical protein VKP59_03795 [Candidatus Thermoplasmatota archaeon]|nr:hypothetical protein [Candidatus Thermoplasmatota archaeon]